MPSILTDFNVRPYEDVPAQIIELSVPDAAAPKHCPIQLLYWPVEGKSNFIRGYENLKDGLSRLLADVPVLVGRLERGSKGDPRYLAVTISSDASVELEYEDISADDTIASYDDLVRNGFPTTGFKDIVSPKMSLGPMVEGSPMMCAKLNLIKGGAILAYGFSHVLADGWANSELGRLWALHAAHVSQGIGFERQKAATPDDEIRRQLSTLPDFDADAPLDAFLQITPSEEATNFLHKDVLAAEKAKKKAREKMMATLLAAGEVPELPRFTFWRFTPEKLKELKQAATSSDASKWISTMDALAGLFWSRIARIQGQSSNGHQQSRCIFALDIRRRLQQPVPLAYVGNVFSPVDAICPLDELESDSLGLKAAAQSMRQANKGWTQPRWEAWLNKIMSLPLDQTLDTSQEFRLQKHNMYFNDYSAFQLNTASWGAPFGQPARTRCLRSGLAGGAAGVWVCPKFPDGSLEVWLTSTAAIQKSLFEDATFNRYAEFVCQYT
uniref:Acyltransferase M4 n=1 Tax=Phoma sp. (strain ATCC 20986 / MF5453) TaxID=1828523 RepID=MFM4_PHOSM|nr:RecName: Full=Acyltransferase M4; Short=AT M4; AltName: Full=Squalestatin S1 biosynthesis cluster protein M4 [Phoma sp. MF5453]AMY15061.1 acyltransferase AT1 [Phoma sp. MF5453]